MAERFTIGKPETVRKLNLIVDELSALIKMNGDQFIKVATVPPVGTTIRLNIAAVLERIMKNNVCGDEGTEIYFGTVTRSLQYADPAGDPAAGYSSYLMVLSGDSAAEEIEVSKTVALESIEDSAGTYDSEDLRDMARWYMVDDSVPLIYDDDLAEYLILANLVPVGDEVDASIRWLEDEGRAAAVYK